MKDFIVCMAIIPILILFMIQIGVDQNNNQIIGVIQSITYAAKEDAKQAGGFTPEIRQSLIDGISEKTGISAGKIKVTADQHIKYRYSVGENRLIHYRVEVEIESIMAGDEFYGIRDEDNRYTYVIDSYTASEKV
ncbi:hypothetical protein [Clostridium aminobutyricum]|uniref:Uncharacterized protein n=1 Tax=Clostridium aminobutyricum TaxID=33953 RepID=A0A939IGK3_CLOAM|nr:hypothetical protein [Clostridium aminobutyricum]MBN7772062.1 hypothetical protein [Clostridium aminobutyricum]